jgi:hypothetical protein
MDNTKLLHFRRMECPKRNDHTLKNSFVHVIHITISSSLKYLHPQGELMFQHKQQLSWKLMHKSKSKVYFCDGKNEINIIHAEKLPWHIKYNYFAVFTVLENFL